MQAAPTNKHSSLSNFQSVLFFSYFQQKLYNIANASPYTKDAFHRYVIEGKTDAVNPLQSGTKVAAHYVLTVPSRGQHIIRCRLSVWDDRVPLPFNEKAFDEVVTRRKHEANEFYKTVIPGESRFYVILFLSQFVFRKDDQLTLSLRDLRDTLCPKMVKFCVTILDWR